MTKPDTLSPYELAEERTEFAAMRTVMAADRSLMAWIRTSLSMISFGFTIYKILQGFQSSGQQLRTQNTPRNVGLFLIGLGTVSVFIGSVQYWQTLTTLSRFQAIEKWRAAFVIALLLFVVGCLLFTGIFIKYL